MPIPKPTEDEEQDAFLDRCMSDPVMTEDFPNEEQRLGVCAIRWEGRDKNTRKTEPANDREIKQVIIPFDRKEITEGGYFEGYGSVFGNIDFGGDVVMPGAFKRSLERWKAKGEWPAMVYIHDLREPIGEYKEMREDETGLFVAGDLWTPDVPRAVQARRMLRSNGPKGLSIGFIAVEVSYEEVKDKMIRFLHEVELLEVSPVLFAMNGLAKPTSAKSLVNDTGVATKRDVEHALCYTLNLTKKQAKAFISGGYEALRDAAGNPSQETREAEESLLASFRALKSKALGESDILTTIKKITE